MTQKLIFGINRFNFNRFLLAYLLYGHSSIHAVIFSQSFKDLISSLPYGSGTVVSVAVSIRFVPRRLHHLLLFEELFVTFFTETECKGIVPVLHHQIFISISLPFLFQTSPKLLPINTLITLTHPPCFQRDGKDREVVLTNKKTFEFFLKLYFVIA